MAPQPPDQTMFAKHGNYPVSYYTGMPQISIPLYSIKEKGIEIPLTLNYSGNGIRVADESTWVGLGWNLYPGGSISRIVVGRRFDSHNSDVYNALLGQWDATVDVDYLRRHVYQTTGYVFRGGDIEGVAATDGTQNEPYTILPSWPVSSMTTWALQAEFFQPEIYTFNFLGFSGKFFFHPETNLPVIMDKKQNLLFEKDSSPWDPELNGWKVTLPNGIVVYFQDLERVQQIAGCSNGAPSLTWKMTKIKLVNNEEINFSYKDWSYETATITNIDVYAYEDDHDYELNRYQYDYEESYNLPFPTVDCDYNKSPAPVLNQLRVLEQISSPSYILNFKTKLNEVRPMLEELEIYERAYPETKIGYKFQFAEFTKANLQWNEINLYSTTPSYFNDEASFRKFKLTGLQKFAVKNGAAENLENPYLFYYHEEIGLPSALSFAQDYWGYYNGREENRGLIPDETKMYANEGYWPVVFLPHRRPLDDLRTRANSNRGTSEVHMKQGALNKIIYPTKGYTKFVFEPHEFYLSDLDDYLVTADEYGNYTGSHTIPSRGAGLRISQIINYDSDASFINRTKFDYNGGLLLEPVHFWIAERYLLTNVDASEVYYYKTWNAAGSNYSQSFLIPNSVGYGNVVVKQSDSEFDHVDEKINGSIRYSFHNYETLYDPRSHSVSFAFLDNRNGLPRSIEYRDASGSTLKKTNFHYKMVESSMFLSMAAKHVLENDEEKFNVFKIEYTPLKCELWKEDYITNWEDGLETTTYNDYSIDGYANLVSKRIENTSDGQIRETKYRYPLDFDVTTPSESTSDPTYIALQKMVERNIVDSPVEVIELKNSKVVSGQLTTYKIFENLPQVYELFSLETGMPVTLNTLPDQNDNALFDWSYMSSGHLTMDNSYKPSADATFNSYDNKGNLRDYTLSSGQSTAYKWGYNRSKPIAAVTNAQNSQYLSVSGQSTKIQPISFSDQPGESYTTTITVDYAGTVKLKLSVNDYPFPTDAHYSGITFGTVTLASGGCGLTTVDFYDVAPGTYTFSILFTTTDPQADLLSACGSIEYPQYTYQTHGIVEFFYEGFEDHTPPGVVENASLAHTGVKYFPGDYVVSFTRPNTRSYIVEYWYLDASGQWQYIRKPYNVSTMTLSEGDAIDDVRIYPSDALMTTYTYDPLVGVTSSTDPNCLTVYYDYDDFGRLETVRDHEKNIVKTHTYHYKE